MSEMYDVAEADNHITAQSEVERALKPIPRIPKSNAQEIQNEHSYRRSHSEEISQRRASDLRMATTMILSQPFKISSCRPSVYWF
jgi:hypothetical protein